MKMLEKAKKFIAAALVFTAFLAVFPLQSWSVTRWEIDEVKRKRDAVAEQKRAQQEIVDGLSEERDSVVDQKLALEEKRILRGIDTYVCIIESPCYIHLKLTQYC